MQDRKFVERACARCKQGQCCSHLPYTHASSEYCRILTRKRFVRKLRRILQWPCGELFVIIGHSQHSFSALCTCGPFNWAAQFRCIHVLEYICMCANAHTPKPTLAKSRKVQWATCISIFSTAVYVYLTNERLLVAGLGYPRGARHAILNNYVFTSLMTSRLPHGSLRLPCRSRNAIIHVPAAKSATGSKSGTL